MAATVRIPAISSTYFDCAQIEIFNCIVGEYVNRSVR